MIVAMAVGCALLTAISTIVVRRVLPWFGSKLSRDSLAWTIAHGWSDLPSWVSCLSPFPARWLSRPLLASVR
jgi:hypothetical protein